MKLIPREDEAAKKLYEQYDAHGYPTLIFADAHGQELDRLGDFVNPEDFLKTIERIRSGDTFAARLLHLDENPGDFEDLQHVVDGLLLRYNLSDAYSRIDAYQATRSDSSTADPSLALLARTLAFEHGWIYRSAGRSFANDWEDLPDLSSLRGGQALRAFFEGNPEQLDREQQANQLRETCFEDAGRIFSMLAGEVIPPEMLSDIGSFAFDNGHYDIAAEFYIRWYSNEKETANASELNSVAWNLYLCRQELEKAVAIARLAYAADASPHVADTLARLLYVTGATDEAIEIQSRAASQLEGDAADSYKEAVEQMKAGAELNDRPEFETYPG